PERHPHRHGQPWQRPVVRRDDHRHQRHWHLHPGRYLVRQQLLQPVLPGPLDSHHQQQPAGQWHLELLVGRYWWRAPLQPLTILNCFRGRPVARCHGAFFSSGSGFCPSVSAGGPISVPQGKKEQKTREGEAAVSPPTWEAVGSRRFEVFHYVFLLTTSVAA